MFSNSEFSYDENQQKLFYYTNEGEKYRLANFEVSIIRRYKLVGQKETTDMVTLLLHGYKDTTMSIRLSELSGLMKKIEQQHPEYHLYFDSRRQYELFKQYLMELYEHTVDDVPIEKVYQNAGWNLTPNNTQYYYSGNDAMYCCSNFRLSNDVCFFPRDLINWELGLLNISAEEIMIPLILHSHLGYTLKLFEMAGYKEQFVMILIGESGSKKTSLSRVMFSLFGEALVNFTATDRAIELALMQRQDSTLILDDLSSGKDKNLAEKFEKILRQLGDSTGRKKSINGGSELESVNTRCAVILTAETDIDALSKSSKLRTLAVNVGRNSLNESILKLYQQDEINAQMVNQYSMLERYMTLYIDYLRENYEQIVNFLIQMKYGDYGVEWNFARQETIFKMLISQAMILLDFWGRYIPLPQFMYERICRALQNVMKMNENRAGEAEPYIMFLKAIAEGIMCEGIVASDKNSCERNARLGYFQTGNLILRPESIYNYVCTYYYRQGKLFSESLPAILNKLYEKNLLEVYEQKDHKPKLLKQAVINNVSQSVICLKWYAVENLLLQQT